VDEEGRKDLAGLLLLRDTLFVNPFFDDFHRTLQMVVWLAAGPWRYGLLP